MDLIEVLEVLDTSKICRTCLSVSANLFSVFELLQENSISYLNLIKSFSKTSTDISFPMGICIECKEFLGVVFEFKKKIETSYNILSKNQLFEDEKYITNTSVDQGVQTEVLHIYSCEQCEDTFLDHDMLKLHREEHGSENFKCKKCEKFYTRLNYLQQHIAVSHPESGQELLINYCGLCSKQFSRKDHLKTHMRNVHKQDLKAEDNYAVEEICESGILGSTDDFVESLNLNLAEDDEEVFNNDDELCVNEILYTNLQVKDEPNTRNELEESFDIDFDEEDEDEKPLIQKSDVGMVIKEEHFEFSCTKCDKSFVSKDQLENHAKKHVNKTKTGTSKSNRAHQCTKCNKSFTRSNHLKRHELTHSSIKPFKCSSCDKGFTRVDHLNLHVLNHHTSSKPYECDFEGCKKGFVRPEHLQKHKDRHNATPIKKEFCSICNKGFSTAKYLQVHMKMHSNDRSFPCKFCSETFTDKTILAEHTAEKHANEKPYLCCECGLRFVRNDYLVIHQRRHQGIKPYKCRFCQKCFPRATDLTVHERYHTNEKSHVCHQCGKSFQRAYNLLVHMRVHSGEKPYQCPHCVKAFAQGNDLKSHIRRHTGERFRCDLCSEGFIQGYHLTHHKRIVHGLDVQSHIRRVEKFVLPSGQEEQEETWPLKSSASKKKKKVQTEQLEINDEIKMEQYSIPESIIEIHQIEETQKQMETRSLSPMQIIYAPQT